MTNLGDEIIRYRAKKRINQSEFARRCGLSTQTICSIENGLQSPSKFTVAKIQLVLEEEEEDK